MYSLSLADNQFGKRDNELREGSLAEERERGGFPRNGNQRRRGAQKQPVSPALTQFPALNYHGAASR